MKLSTKTYLTGICYDLNVTEGEPRVFSQQVLNNKFNNSRARTLYSIYHMTNTLKSHFWRKKRYNFVIMYATLLWTS